MTYLPDATRSAEAMRHIARARMVVLRKTPYFAKALTQLRFVPVTGLGTFGVTKRGLVYFDVDLVLSGRWTTENIAGVIVHELMHRLNRHAERAEAYGVQKDEFRLWNEVCDAEINHQLDSMYFLPDMPVKPDTLGLGLSKEWSDDAMDFVWLNPEGQNVPILAEHLMSLVRENQPSAPPSNAQPSRDSGSDTGDGQGDDADGSGDGTASGGNTDSGDDTTQSGGSGDGAQGGDDTTQGDGSGSGDPSYSDMPSSLTSPAGATWDGCGSGVGAGCGKDFEDELERQFLDDVGDPGLQEHELKQLIKDTARHVIAQASGGASLRAYTPSALQRWADEYASPSRRLPWAKLLERKARNLLTVNGQRNYSYDKPARRQATYGYGSGTPVLPRLSGNRPRVAVAVDVSGSVCDRDLDQMVSQLQSITRGLRSKISVCAFDDTLKGPKKVSNVKNARDILRGGGGTVVANVFDTYNKPTNRPDVLIIMTDGCIWDAPTVAPKYHVIWCLVGQYRRKPMTPNYENVRFGEYVDVENLHGE